MIVFANVHYVLFIFSKIVCSLLTFFPRLYSALNKIPFPKPAFTSLSILVFTGNMLELDLAHRHRLDGQLILNVTFLLKLA